MTNLNIPTNVLIDIADDWKLHLSLNIKHMKFLNKPNKEIQDFIDMKMAYYSGEFISAESMRYCFPELYDVVDEVLFCGI